MTPVAGAKERECSSPSWSTVERSRGGPVVAALQQKLLTFGFLNKIASVNHFHTILVFFQFRNQSFEKSHLGEPTWFKDLPFWKQQERLPVFELSGAPWTQQFRAAFCGWHALARRSLQDL